MCHGVNKDTKKTGNWGPGPWNSETVELRNYSEITPKLWDRGRGTMELLRSYTKITPKLRTVELWNYSEVIPKLLRN